MSPDDALMVSYLLLAGKSLYVPGHLSEGSCSQQNAKVNALVGLHLEEGKGGSKCTL